MNDDPFATVQAATRAHLERHGCGAYTFEDGPGLTALSAETKPERILELGTALGYTACCLASGNPAATVDTIEGDSVHVSLAKEQIVAVGLADRITVHHGDFETVLSRLIGNYDLVFFDGYAPSAKMILLLRSRANVGATLICANVGLTGGFQNSELARELNDANRWHAMAPIERGQTLVVSKK